MNLNYETVTGSQAEKPAELDTTSSVNFVYYRKNIKQIEQTDEHGNAVKLWQYDEAKVTKQEYLQNCIDDNAQALADLAAMIGG